MRKLLIAATILAGFTVHANAASFHCTSADCHAGPSSSSGVQLGNTATGGAGGNASQSGIISQTPTLNQSGSQVGNSRSTSSASNTSRNTNANVSSNHVSNGSSSTSAGGRGVGGGASVGNSGNTEYRAAANVASLPSVGGGGFDCPVVGVGLSGSVVTGSGVGVASWISQKCNDRKIAELMIATGHERAAMIFLATDDARVRDAFKQEIDQNTQDEVSAFVPSAWCAKASKIERVNNPGSCGPQ